MTGAATVVGALVVTGGDEVALMVDAVREGFAVALGVVGASVDTGTAAPGAVGVHVAGWTVA